VSSRYYDSIAVYIREVGDLPLLTAEEETQLSAQIKAASAAAREKLITHNVRLVLTVAQQYIGRGVELADLTSWGIMGLMRATQSYDGTRGVRFCSYACFWIRQRILREISNCGCTVRTPAHVTDKLRVIWRSESKLTEELGREPTDSELAAELHISRRQLAQIVALQSAWSPWTLRLTMTGRM
jgi:RNA polymerase primary sigma factor